MWELVKKRALEVLCCGAIPAMLIAQIACSEGNSSDGTVDTDIDSDTGTGSEQSTGANIGPAPCGCETSQGDFGVVNDTIVVAAGEIYDGGCQVFYGNPDTLGDGSQDEGQKPVFKVVGGTLRNVILGAPAADGIHVYGDVVLENIHWLDIGEDAMTVKASGTVRLDCGSATNGDDKMFQVNSASEIYISNFTGSSAGKFMRQLGGSTFHVDVYIDHCFISHMKEAIFRTDSATSHVTLTNTRYVGLGGGLFMFGSNIVDGNSEQSTVENNQGW